jgi:hypothetical protein
LGRFKPSTADARSRIPGLKTPHRPSIPLFKKKEKKKKKTRNRRDFGKVRH